jgi:hypothetical protein
MNPPFRICALLGASLLAGTAGAQPLGSTVPPTVANPNRYAVSGVGAAARFVHMAATRRVDIAIIGDSNTRQLNVTGHEDGMARGFAARFGVYATRIETFMPQDSWQAFVFASGDGQATPFTIPVSPTVADPYTFLGDGFPLAFGYLPSGQTVYSTYNIGLSIDPSHPIGIEHPLRYHFSDIAMGGGSYAFSVRAPWPGDAFSNFFAAQIAPAPESGVRDLSFDIPAGERASNGLMIVPANAAQSLGSAGPLMVLYNRVERTDQPTGIAYSPMWFQGGQSARKALASFLQSDQNVTAMREWMRQATREQGTGDGVLLVHIMHGGNDAGDTLPSLGPIGGLPSYQPPGQTDNTRGIINWLRSAWVGAGRDPSLLFFLLGPYHPLADRFELQQGYEQGWRDIAGEDSQVFTIAGTMLSTPAEFEARGFNRSEADHAHLSIDGYWTWGTTTVGALTRAACPADFDGSGTLSVSDIFAFINAWFLGQPSTDFDYSGALEVGDIFAFLNSWFSGC